MTNEDKRIRELYTEIYGNAVPSAEFKRKVRNMTENSKKRTKITMKVVCALTAAAVIAVAGGAIASATKGYRHQAVYDTVIVNGEEKKVKYGKQDNDVRFWEYVEDGKMCGVFVYGPYDDENDTLYIVDNGDYILASTDPNPTLNFYEELDNTPYAEIEEDTGSLIIKGNPKSENNWYFKISGFSFVEEDEKDGAKDGRFAGDPDEVYAIMPNGTVVQTIKETYVYTEDDEELDAEIWDDVWEEMGSPEIETSESE